MIWIFLLELGFPGSPEVFVLEQGIVPLSVGAAFGLFFLGQAIDEYRGDSK